MKQRRAFKFSDLKPNSAGHFRCPRNLYYFSSDADFTHRLIGQKITRIEQHGPDLVEFYFDTGSVERFIGSDTRDTSNGDMIFNEMYLVDKNILTSKSAAAGGGKNKKTRKRRK